jgi:hypothetical protein
MIESNIKDVNCRVKRTEKFWNRPARAEHLLQVRAAVLRDDDRLSQWILNRPGSYFYRPSTSLAAAAPNQFPLCTRRIVVTQLAETKSAGAAAGACHWITCFRLQPASALGARSVNGNCR